MQQLGTLIVFLPFILFVLMLLILYINLRGKFNLSDALTETNPGSQIVKNDQYNIQNIKDVITQLEEKDLLASQIPVILPSILPPTKQISSSEKCKSSSRYLALITALTGLIIAICMVTFYMYSFIKNPAHPVDFSGMAAVLVSLIVGIAPYSFNKLSEGIKSNP